MERFVSAIVILFTIIAIIIVAVFGFNVLRAALPATLDASAKLGAAVGNGITDIVNPGYVAPQPAPTAAPAPAPVAINPPVVPIFPGARVVQRANANIVCATGADLANSNGWKVVATPDSVTNYGGVVVEIPSGTQLPAGWEFVGEPGRTPSQGGVFSIYPPNGMCRDQLGVSR